MAISRADLEKVALLARLTLTDEELATMTPQVAAILEYVDQLNAVNTDGVEPMAHAVELRNVLREDLRRTSLLRESALASAPKHNHEGYLAPAVLGE
ncbi:Aspartyl/glutamyl-tRNA(Asn/Gln) amidotransferase subunit C [Pirellulimonas nuda]|uniref:Aspartyl/glutamyl-tRNA(Asn/Gln) amidotransferase subunit C n=1 Tax=Pirellulimonas nuda TaxID=2528009 RepID=A0A518DB03_9BACT|nr:Asp-tRNA(Asn)/Glu-tRNA(Gln) amidotransferase subunit GatC [Pirellulimonas nuda]QDU88664.1 Aspartyl/glutamyl-tRNA(Asn/Gln) amidotransferase subunit C [Pirellulimonas nuda]